MRTHLILISVLVILGTGDFAVGEDCDSTLSAGSGPTTLVVTSKILSSGKPCHYTINGTDGNFVKIDLQKKASVASKSECETSFVKLEGVIGGFKTELATVCKETDYKTYYSPGPQMFVTIQGNNALGAETFNITYQSVASVKTICGETALDADTSDSKDWTAPTAEMAVNQICAYIITAKPGEVVKLTFKQIASSPKEEAHAAAASKTLIRLENLNNGEKTLIANISAAGQENLVYMSNREKMIVTLFGSTGLLDNLFTAVYKSVNLCGVVPGEATKEEQWINVYTEEGNIPQTHRCEWTVTAPADEKVDVYLKNETDSSEKQCVDVIVKGETTPKWICRKGDNSKLDNSPPVVVKFPGPGENNEYKNFKIYYKISAANHMPISIVSLLVLAILCFLPA